jgi:hypothetical protein
MQFHNLTLLVRFSNVGEVSRQYEIAAGAIRHRIIHFSSP